MLLVFVHGPCCVALPFDFAGVGGVFEIQIARGAESLEIMGSIYLA